METSDERRRRKLADLKKAVGLDAVAAAAGLAGPESLDQIIKGVKLPKRKDGEQVARALGDETARKIEKGLKLARGWFDEDWPFPRVERSLWEVLDNDQRIHAQTVMTQVLHACASGKPTLIVQMQGVQPQRPSGQVAHLPAPPKNSEAFEADLLGNVGGEDGTSDSAGGEAGTTHRRRLAKAAGKSRARRNHRPAVRLQRGP